MYAAFACLIIAGSIAIITLWITYYYYVLYKYHWVYMGYGDPNENNYRRISKKEYWIYTCLFEGVIICLFIYFYFVCKRWAEIAENP